MSAAPPLAHCPLCGEPHPADHQIRVCWRTLAWEQVSEPGVAQLHERWLTVCEECASSAALFRLDFPRAAAVHRTRTFQLVILFGITLALLLVVLFAGRGLTNSADLGQKAAYGAAWFVLAIFAVVLFLQGALVANFELSHRRRWTGPWLERRLPTLLALPTGDGAAYWWKLELETGFESRPIPPPPPPPPAPRPLPPPPPGSITFAIRPEDY